VQDLQIPNVLRHVVAGRVRRKTGTLRDGVDPPSPALYSGRRASVPREHEREQTGDGHELAGPEDE
jgi:hypothetical protein